MTGMMTKTERTVAEVVAEGLRPSVLNLTCPHCGAGPGEPCGPGGRSDWSPSHEARRDALRVAVAAAKEAR